MSSSPAPTSYLIGVDTGGTYTDAVLFDDATGVIAKAHLYPDHSTQRKIKLFGDTTRNTARSDATRLRVCDATINAAPNFKTQLGKLRALARTSFTSDDDNLRRVQRSAQRVQRMSHWKRRRIGDDGDERTSSRALVNGTLD